MIAFLRALVAGWFIVGAMWLLGLGLSHVGFPWKGVLFFAGWLGLAFPTLFIARQNTAVLWMWLLATAPAVTEMLAYRNFKPVVIVALPAPDGAAEHLEADGFRFADAHVEVGLGVRVTSRHGSSAHGHARQVDFYSAAPLVPAGWTPHDPVPAWVVADDDAQVAEWRLPLRAALVEQLDVASWREAVQQSQREHGLTSVADAPYLRWIENPTETRREDLRTPIEMAAALAVVWPLGFGIGTLVARRRRKASAHR